MLVPAIYTGLTWGMVGPVYTGVVESFPYFSLAYVRRPLLSQAQSLFVATCKASPNGKMETPGVGRLAFVLI